MMESKTNKYTIEELKEKVLSNIDKESKKVGLPSLSSVISEDLNDILPLVDKAYKELIKEKLNTLQHDRRGNCDEGFKVEVIEEIFNIKLNE